MKEIKHCKVVLKIAVVEKCRCPGWQWPVSLVLAPFRPPVVG